MSPALSACVGTIFTSTPFVLAWLIHGLIALAGIVCALSANRWWTAILIGLGAVLGAVLAVVPLTLMMAYEEARTGFGAGNAGVLFCCTIPVVPIVCMAIGGSIGYWIDAHRASEAETDCPKCGYCLSATGGRINGCPECGWGREASSV